MKSKGPKLRALGRFRLGAALILGVYGAFWKLIDASADPPRSDRKGPKEQPIKNSMPAAETTGPYGMKLIQSPSIRINRPFTMIEGIDVTGTIEVNASYVKIVRTRVTTGSWVAMPPAMVQKASASRTSRLMGEVRPAPCSTGIVGSAYVSRANIHSTENGIFPHSNSVVRNSFIHDLAASGSHPHYHGIQLDGGQENIQIDHNSVDLGDHQWTSSLMINNQFGLVRNIEITNNLFVGGAYTIFADGKFSDQPISDVVLAKNGLRRGEFGFDLVKNASVSWKMNVDLTTGESIDGP
jgi:hypothetical protein